MCHTDEMIAQALLRAPRAAFGQVTRALRKLREAVCRRPNAWPS